MNKPLVLIAAIVAAAIAVDDGQAQASHVSCGDTITADTTLDSDLAGCPNNGIVIGADDITLDLNGHTIGGDDDDIGVVDDGHDGVTVMNGSVSQFNVGVMMEGGKRNEITRNRLLHTGAGIIVGSGSENVITDNDLSQSRGRHPHREGPRQPGRR